MGGRAFIVNSFFSDPFFQSHIYVKALKMQGFPNN